MEEPRTVKWKLIEPLDPATVETNGRIAGLEALRDVWRQQLEAVDEAERVRRRQRSLRRLAVETGIIERLYDLEWGLTLTLVAEGFAREVLERTGARVDEWTLATLNAQRDALEMVIDFVNSHRRLSASFIKELHQAITRTQTTYDAVDVLGQVVTRDLPRGMWKQWPNHVERLDGSILEYCPPEHVSSEIDNLTSWYEDLEAAGAAHPIVRAAWLHHRFVQIHPFADGNGRVARCLTLLVMQRHRYAPLVVDRNHRKDYLGALDLANDGNLNALVQLFTNLESSALAGELEQAETPEIHTSRQVARTLAAQLAHRREKETSARAVALKVRATHVLASAKQWMTSKRDELRSVFGEQGINDAVIDSFSAQSDRPEIVNGTPRHLFHRRQVIDSAHEAGHYAYLGGFVGQLTLRVRVEGMRLNYVASLHGAGVDSGVLAVTTFAVIRVANPDSESEDVIDVPTTADAFYFSHSESVEALNGRTPELEQLLDEGLTVALAELMNRI